MNTVTTQDINPETNLPLVLYHANCADGFGAAFAAWKKLGDDGAIYVPVSYDKFKFNVETGELTVDGVEYVTTDREVYILDFSFPVSIMEALFSGCSKVIWLDHHKSVFDAYKLPLNLTSNTYYNALDIGITGNHVVLLDNTRSGALIAWEYFHPAGYNVLPPKLIRHLDDYDRWQFKIEGTKEFNKALWSYAPWSFEQWNTMPMLLAEYSLEGYYDEGAAILRAHDQNVQSVIASSKRECSLMFFESHEIDNPHEDGKTLSMSRQVVVAGLAANCPKHLASDVGHHLATESGTYGLCWFVDTHGAIECSLRSNGDFDVSAIAKKFGGGGHKNASGFKLSSIEVLNKFFYPNRREL